MNLKLTRKDVVNGICGEHRSASYCTLQSTIDVLRSRGCVEVIGYNCGYYGWNFDCYVITDENGNRPVVLTTGYRNLVGDMIRYDICKYLENNAESMSTVDILNAIINNK